jgi:glycosyltransferase involved in cell wall biosynthesis
LDRGHQVNGSALHVGIDARVLGERGVGRYLSNLLRGLADIKGKHQFTLFTLAKSQTDLAPKDSRFKIVNLGKLHPALAEQWVIPREAARRGVQVLHYPDNSGAIAPGLPMVLTMHDGMWQRPLGEALLHPTLRQRLQDRYRKFVCPRAARAANAVITVSNFSAQEIQKSLALGTKLRVIPNAVDDSFRHPLSSSTCKRLLKGLGLNHPFIFCSGAADRRKNISRLIQAFALSQIENIELVVSSLRPGEKETTDYEATVKQAGLEGRVRFLGFVSEDELKALYQTALAYIFPSLWEGFGLPILEAYALGCPVLCSNVAALPEVAGNGARFVDPLKIESIAEGLKAILRGPRSVWTRKGRRELGRFSWAKTARETFAAYQRALR